MYIYGVIFISTIKCRICGASQNVLSLSIISRVIKLRRMKWAEKIVVCMGKMSPKFGKKKREDCFWDTDIDGKNNSTVGLGKIYSESVNWLQIVSLCESIYEPSIYIKADMSWSLSNNCLRKTLDCVVC
jgi:hypothetical protein